VGVGGLGCPAALALARAGVRLRLCDDDRIELHNLHRQILFSDADVGRDKLDVAREALLAAGATEVEVVRSRLLPETAEELVRGTSVIVEGADNFATKFLAADAGHLAQVPVVHGAAVRWHGTVLLARGRGAPCYRCLFEDLLPDEDAPNCSVAGVIGPAAGLVGALMADLALDVLMADDARAGTIFSFDGKSGRLRGAQLTARPGCSLCGTGATIRTISSERYWPPTCATLGPAAAPGQHGG
jgi:adenylyltransferase/sulfurtransferase